MTETVKAKPVFLIAEDDQDDQLLIRIAVNEACRSDIQILFVEDGIELIDFLQKHANGSLKPDLILLDLNMPRKDGREVLQDIKANPMLADIPLVILTTSGRVEDFQFCQSLGVDGYHTKPASIAELREITRQLCEKFLHPGRSKNQV